MQPALLVLELSHLDCRAVTGPRSHQVSRSIGRDSNGEVGRAVYRTDARPYAASLPANHGGSGGGLEALEI